MTRLAANSRLARTGAMAFLLWGLLHITGSAFILVELATGGPSAGYAVYSVTDLPTQAIAGAALGYMSFLIAASGLAACGIALRLNWRNSEVGLALNTGLVLVIEVGLAVFLVLPGHVSLAEALPGLILFGAGATLGGIACRKGSAHGT